MASNTSVSQGWHHWVGVYDGSELKIYLDGQLEGSVAVTGNISSTGDGDPNWLTIGKDYYPTYSSGRYNQGSIDEVRIFDQALSQYHVQTLYSETSRSCVDCTSDPAAAWYMDESGWNGTADEVVDSSGNNHHGVAVNGVNTTATAKVGRSGDFDGVDDYVNAGNYPGLDFTGNAQATFMVWVKTTDVTGSLIEAAGGGCSDYGLRITNGKAQFFIETSNCSWEGWVASINTINDDTWHHIAATMDGNNYRIYVDGVLENTVGQTGTIFNSGALSLGKSFGGTDWYDGLMDEVYIYDRALTSYEISNMMNQTHPCAGCVSTQNFSSFPRNKWVLLGVPVTPDPADPLSVLGDDFGGNPSNGTNWDVARWDVTNMLYNMYSSSPGTFPDMTPGLGFWAIQDVLPTTTVDATGLETSDNHSIDLVGPLAGAAYGKNMAANPYVNKIDWSDAKVSDGTTTLSILDAATQGWVNSHAYVWNYTTSMYEIVTPNESSAADTLSAWEGFFFLQMDAGKSLDLIFKKSPGSPKLLAMDDLFVSSFGDEVRSRRRYEQQGTNDWSGILYLHTQDGAYTALNNRFGVNPNSADGFDGLDASWLGPGFATEYGALYFVAPDGSQLLHDIRNPEWSEKLWHFKVKDQNVNGNWFLRWPNTSSIPGNIELSLESPEGTVLVQNLRETQSYNFNLSSGNEQDFYLRAIVGPDSLPAGANIGFVQNPGVTNSLDMYLFPDEPLDDLFLFVDSEPVTMGHVDDLYNVYRGSLEMGTGGEKEVVMHLIDLETNVTVDTLEYNFVLAGGSGSLLVSAPGNDGMLSIPRQTLPDGTWVGMGVYNAGTLESTIYLIQPYGLVLPEGSELIISVDDKNMDLRSFDVCRKTFSGWEVIPAEYDIGSGLIRAKVKVSGNYGLRRSLDGGTGGLLPSETALMANYPNPFNATTVIPYNLQEPSMVSLNVYDLLGRKVIELVHEYKQAGYNRQQWNGRDQYGIMVSSGIYIIRLEAGRKVQTRKLMLLK